MWEAIRANKRKSFILISLMGTFMILAGMLLVEAIAPGAYMTGGVIALILWAVLSLTSFYSGDSIFLASAGAQQIHKEDHPTLFNIVEEMCIASGLSTIPKVYIIDDPSPNAFAVGRDPEHASVAVTAGLLNRLNRDEVQGVIAHELAHVQNRDTLYVMLAAMMVGVVALLSHFFLRYMWYSGGRHRSRRESKGGGQAQAVILVIAVLFAILGPIAVQLLYFALSRRREYLSDACGALYTRYPEGLASALEKISANPGLKEKKNKVMAPMYIVNPLQASGAAGLGSTHPATEERVRILRSMAGASLADYEAAAAKTARRSVVPKSAVAASRPVGVRPPWREEEPRPAEPGVREKTRQTGDLLRRLSNYAFINCPCGVIVKVPPSFKSSKVRCPRCGRMHDVPHGVKAR
ncbi:MAG: M48 family metallopeptidase [bacterium]|nr:M48 family metallopeptidase [bacterium]